MFELKLFKVAIATTGTLGLRISLEKPRVRNRETGEELFLARISSSMHNFSFIL